MITKKKALKKKVQEKRTQAKKQQNKLTAIERQLRNKKAKIAEMKGQEPDHNPRPKSIYSQIIAELICGQLAEGKHLKHICAQEGYPSVGTVMDWAQHPDEINRPGFTDLFLKSRELGYLVMADEIVDIADDSSRDKKRIMVKGVEIEVIDHENIQRDKLRVDARKFIVSKTLPKIYGDKVNVEVSGSLDLVAKLTAARQRLQRDKERSIAEEAAGPGLIESVDEVAV